MSNQEYMGDVRTEDPSSAQGDVVWRGGTLGDMSYGAAVLLVSTFGGGTMFGLECITFLRSKALVMPWLWYLRVLLYAALSAPGYYAAAPALLDRG